jgi:hypothetical protein
MFIMKTNSLVVPAILSPVGLLLNAGGKDHQRHNLERRIK